MLKHIILSSGDAALIVSGVVVMTADPAFEEPSHVEMVAEKLSEALEQPLQRIERAVPTDEEWNWNGVLEETEVNSAFGSAEPAAPLKVRKRYMFTRLMHKICDVQCKECREVKIPFWIGRCAFCDKGEGLVK